MTLDEAGLYYAHSENDKGNGCRDALVDHLKLVAERAARYASVFDAEQQVAAAGLLHDLGKYADQFQRRLELARLYTCLRWLGEEREWVDKREPWRIDQIYLIARHLNFIA